MVKRPQNGVTLIELILVIGIIGAITASVGYMFVGGMRAWSMEDVHTELLQNNQSVLAQVSESLERARSIIVAGQRQIEFSTELGQAVGSEDGISIFKQGASSWESLNGNSPQSIPSGTAVLDIIRLEDTALIAAGSDGYVYRSVDAGNTWSALKLGDATEVRAIARVDETTLYAATANKGDVYKSLDAGLSWSNTGELDGAVTVRSLAVAQDGTVWAGADWTGAFNIFKTADGGVSWTGITASSLPTNMWAYRVPVLITNSTSTDLRDYQVRIPVTYQVSKMNLDFSDIRFRDASETDLPYWMEYCDSGTDAIFWVNIPRIDRNSTLTIYMYYGNPSAASLSDITTTMNELYSRYDIAYEWTPQTSWSSIASGDDTGEWVNFQYSFPYYREFQNTIYACTNGYLSFGDTYGNDYRPRTNNFNQRAMIAPFWEDLRTDMSYGSISQPGIYVDSFEDHTIFTYHAVSYRQWRAGPVRYRAELRFQVETRRNGDVRFSYEVVRNTNRMSPIAGLSKGTGSDFVIVTNNVAQGRSFLFGIREYVEPEPTVVFGEEEILASTGCDVLTLLLQGGILYCGTTTGEVFSSTDGGSTWLPAADLTDAAYIHRLFADYTGIIFAGTEPGGVVFKSADPAGSWTLCTSLTGADRVRAFGETLEKRLICGASPTGSVYTSANKGVSWNQMPVISGVSSIYCLRPILKKLGFSWTGNRFQDTNDRNDMALRSSGGLSSVISNGYTDDFKFEYFNSDMTPADTSTPAGISMIAIVKFTMTSSSESFSLSDSVSIALRNSQ